MENLNEKLQVLYESCWSNLCEKMGPVIKNDAYEVKPTYPLLLSVYWNDDEQFWENADIRVMVFGKETNGWAVDGSVKGVFDITKSYDDIIPAYSDFYGGEEYKAYGGQFWNGFRLFAKKLRDKYPNKKVDFLWNNIVKIGKAGDKGLPPQYIYNIEKEYFSVVQEEVNLLKPDIILFLTGHAYDNKIEDKFGNVSFTPLSVAYKGKELAKLTLSNVPLAYRTYNPGYLYRRGKEYIHSCFDAIVSDINII
jgi:hypothetical protein